ncbi:unnamed protein product [Withania somnifera]
MPKKSNSKNLKPVELAVVEKEKPKKLGTEIDEIFAGKKRKKPDNQEKSSGSAVSEPKKLNKNKEKSGRIIMKDEALSEPARKPRKKTADGFSLYTEEELGIGKSNAGGTPLCPFDCHCCF